VSKYPKKISYLIFFVLTVGIFNLHFGIRKTCEQVNHVECKSMLENSNDFEMQDASCCTSNENVKYHSSKNILMDNYDNCNCFHFIEHDAELITSLKPVNFFFNLQTIAEINIQQNNSEKEIKSLWVRNKSETKSIPILLQTESFLN
jgi:hypothetical protein